MGGRGEEAFLTSGSVFLNFCCELLLAWNRTFFATSRAQAHGGQMYAQQRAKNSFRLFFVYFQPRMLAPRPGGASYICLG